MSPLRILHVTPYSATAWSYGGIPRVVAALTREQARQGHHVTVCTTDAFSSTSRLAAPSNGFVAPLPHCPIAPLAHCSTAPLPSAVVQERVFPNVSNWLAYHAQFFTPIGLNRYLRKHAHEFDVAHLHACRNLPGAIAAHHLRRAGVPFILAPNGTAPRLERRFLAKRIADRLFADRMLRDAARVIAVSEAERRQLLALGVDESRIRVIPNPVDLEEFEEPIAHGRFRAAHDLGDAPVVMFLGKLTPRKRVDVLIRAFAALDRERAQLVIAGNDMGEAPALRALIASLDRAAAPGAPRLSARVTFTGATSDRARLEALADADVVVYPSADEIFGLVPLEALLAGTPVIVADDSGCGEVIRAIDGGDVIPLGDVPALSARIAAALDGDREAQASRIRAAAGRIRERFSAAKTGSDLFSTVIEVVGTDLGQDAGQDAVSFVIPVRNGAPWLRAVVAAIRADAGTRETEIIAVDDGSTDGSADILAELEARGWLRVLRGPGRGAAAAINAGLRAARFPLVAQIDQDVVIAPGWIDTLTAAMRDPRVAAAQGHYICPPRAPLPARVMGVDLTQRYDALRGRATGHVCTGNVIYRAHAIADAGLFDESLGYGYDNDISYRLRAAGHRLAICHGAQSVHHWRSGFSGYARQQYGFGYGRLDLVAKHPARLGGDSVSPLGMMLHPIVLLVALLLAVTAAAAAFTGHDGRVLAGLALALVSALAIERGVAGVRATLRFREPAALLFPVYHLVRDAAWVCAIAMWSARRLLGRRSAPQHSMTARERHVVIPAPMAPEMASAAASAATSPAIAVIPAHNESTLLPSVLDDLRAHCPNIDVLVVDDGSRDGTWAVARTQGVHWLRLPERMGVGSAVRAGLCFAERLGYRTAIRLDGDGQHSAADIARLLAPIADGRADVTLGSRYIRPHDGEPKTVRVVQRLLAACLSRLVDAPVTDPTSGFYAFGPRALAMLAEHHPTGYPEPELRLFLDRNALTAVEVPVRALPRLGGRTSLTPLRVTAAAARVLLAMLVVPLRRSVGDANRD